MLIGSSICRDGERSTGSEVTLICPSPFSPLILEESPATELVAVEIVVRREETRSSS